MAVEQVLRDLILSYGPATSLLGKRVHPMQAPEQSVFPCCVYTEASRKTAMTYGGPILLDRYGITYEVYGTGAGSVKAAARAIRDRLLGFVGDVPTGRVLGIFDEDETDGVEQPLFDEERGIYFVSLSFAAWYQPNVQGG